MGEELKDELDQRSASCERRLPQNVDDRPAMLTSLDRLGALERAGARIFFGHDPEFWRGVPQAAAAIG